MRWTLALVPLLVLGCSDAPPLYEGMPDHVRRRHVVMEGAPNFRDLGGYETEDGRTVKWGTFYRSDKLADLTDADLARMKTLGIRLVCDFRGPDEWREEPDRLPADDPPEVAHLEIWDPSFSPEGVRELLEGGGDDDAPVDLGELLVEGNRMFATKFADRYAAMMERLSDPANLPALVHCTAGKDRAGFASAVILRSLGVPMETIYEDFLLTNHYTAAKIDRAVQVMRVVSLFRVDEEDLRAVMGVERRFLEAAFQAIDESHGSFDAYRREALGVSDEELIAFRELGLDGVAKRGTSPANEVHSRGSGEKIGANEAGQ